MASDGPISYLPSAGLSYDPNDGLYWDEEALGQEVTRAFEVCHGCRMCFKYCDSFPSLFAALDENHDGDVRKITEDEKTQIFDSCFQCKLCEVQCPYTVRDNHEYQLDFPKLVHRWRAQKTRSEGVGRRERFLGNPDLTAKIARSTGNLANALNQRSRLHREFLKRII